MPKLKDIDPLLALAKALVLFLQVVLAIAVIALLIALPVMLTHRAEIAAGLAAGGTNTPVSQGMAAIAGFLLLAALLFAAVAWFFRLLGRMIDTVSAGDPFTPANATRLGQMAWIALGVQVGSMLVEVLGAWLGALFPQGINSENWEFSVEGDLDLAGNGLILALVLFILARVFRRGAQMRDELEGTV